MNENQIANKENDQRSNVDNDRKKKPIRSPVLQIDLSFSSSSILILFQCSFLLKGTTLFGIFLVKVMKVCLLLSL